MNMLPGLAASLILLLSGCLQMHTASTDNRIDPPAAAPVASSSSGSNSQTWFCADTEMLLLSDATTDSDIDRILAFYARFHQLPAAQQTREYQTLSHTHEREPSLTSAYQLALVLLTPDRDFSDPGRARQLLDDNKNDQHPATEVEALGRLLLVMSGENQKLQLRLNTEKEKAATLKLQLEELRNIETIIRERNINSTPDTRL